MSQPRLQISSSPHVHSGESIPHIMRAVIWSLTPATAMSVVLFGWPAFLVIAVTTLSCLAAEFLFNKIRRRASTVGDRSAALTGLLLALTLPPHTPWWICVTGGFFAIIVGKQVYGGLGFNMFNPALIARVFLLISFPVEMTFWPGPTPLFSTTALDFSHAVDLIFGLNPQSAIDAMTAATPLGQLQVQTRMGKTVADALFGTYGFNYIAATGGNIRGSLGETSALLLAAGGLYLLWKRIITWHIPFTMLAGTLIPATIFWIMSPDKYPDPIFHLITGGLIIGAFFMATDMVTSPMTTKGQIIFGLGCGLLTYIIRSWGGYPEGVSFAIVIMNAVVPLIDQYTKPTIYGQVVKAKESANA